MDKENSFVSNMGKRIMPNPSNFKTCPACKKELDHTKFSIDGKRKDGLAYECKLCACERLRLWRLNNQDKHRNYNHKYYQDNKQKKREYGRKWRINNPERDKANRLKYTYNMSLEEYHNLIKEQNGECAICGRITKLFVDHNHKTNSIRGLLCQQCNTLLGNASDNIEILLNAIKYLENSIGE